MSDDNISHFSFITKASEYCFCKKAKEKLYCYNFSFQFFHLYTDYNNGAITNATIDINFKRILSDGPDVSLKGSPTVSPTTVAL